MEIISGNATYGEADGLGGGILVSGGSVTVSGGYITNNKYAKFFAATMAGVTMAALGLLPITAPMSPFLVARLLAIILKKLVAAFTLPIKINQVWHGSTLREELLPLT